MKTPKETIPVVVYRTAGRLPAEVVRGRLIAEGIPAILQYDAAAAVYPVTVDGIGEVRILVPEPLAQAAREVIARFEAKPSNIEATSDDESEDDESGKEGSL